MGAAHQLCSVKTMVRVLPVLSYGYGHGLEGQEQEIRRWDEFPGTVCLGTSRIRIGSWKDLTFSLWKTAKIVKDVMQAGSIMGVRLFPNWEVGGSAGICVSWYFWAHPQCQQELILPLDRRVWLDFPYWERWTNTSIWVVPLAVQGGRGMLKDQACFGLCWNKKWDFGVKTFQMAKIQLCRSYVEEEVLSKIIRIFPSVVSYLNFLSIRLFVLQCS